MNIDIFYLPLKLPQLYEEFINKIRVFYKKRNYTEVFTPIIQDEPNLERYIDAIEVDINYCNERKRVFLHTSPERCMKSLLKYYKNNIFQIAKVFRDKECGKLNNTEFTMLECYNIKNLDIISEIQDLLFELFGNNIRDISTTPKLINFEEAFESYTGIAFSTDEDILKNNLISFGYEFDDNDSWEEIVNMIMAQFQDKLGKGNIEFLINFPCKIGMFAKCKDDVSNRFELFIDGIEIANGWIEENNEQKIKNIIQHASSFKRIKDKEKLLKDYHNDFEYAGYSIGIERLFYFYAIQKGLI